MLAPPALRPSVPTSASTPNRSKTTPRPTLLKRQTTLKRSYDDTQLMEIPSSPMKRTRVTFDADVEILSADDEEDLDPLVVKEQVRRSLQRLVFDDDDAEYERIRSVFVVSPEKTNAPSTKTLRVYLQAVLANVSNFNRESSSLAHAVINSEWIGRDEAYFTLFVKFLGNLAAAQSGYVGKIMQVLVDFLGPQKTRRLPDAKPVRAHRIHRRALQTIQYLAQLVPSASGVLLDKIASKLEFDFQKSEQRMTYVENFMELIKYVPELNSEILTNILRQLIKLDAAIQVDLDEEDDDAEDDILQYMSSSQTLVMANSQTSHDGLALSDEDADASTTDESDTEPEEDMDPAALRRQKLKDDVKQVDMIMDILFKHYTRLVNSSDLQVRHNAIEQLVAQFHSLILPTYRSRHPQFLIFHFAQTDPIIVDRFVTSCVAVLVDKKQPQVLRHASAAYFSGFVGRGAHVSPSVVQDCLDLLCSQLSMLRRAYEPTCRSPDIKRYGDFYSIFQAIMYIFCFRWRDIGSSASDIEDDFEQDDVNHYDDKQIEDYQFPDSIREAIQAAIYSTLNPLRVCTPAIVEQFARITMTLQFLYMYPKIEENKRVRVATSWRITSDGSTIQAERDSSWVGADGMLEGYFPYDPYHLPLSRQYIESDYVEWKGIPGDDEEDSDSEDEDDEIIESDLGEQDDIDSD